MHAAFLLGKACWPEYFLASFFSGRIQRFALEKERRKDADEEMLVLEVQGKSTQLSSRT